MDHLFFNVVGTMFALIEPSSKAFCKSTASARPALATARTALRPSATPAFKVGTSIHKGEKDDACEDG